MEQHYKHKKMADFLLAASKIPFLLDIICGAIYLFHAGYRLVTELLGIESTLPYRVEKIYTPVDGVPTLYLLRIIIGRATDDGECLYVHRFMASDGRVPHDHPFFADMWQVRGGYTEHKYKGKKLEHFNYLYQLYAEVTTRRCGDYTKLVPSRTHFITLEDKYEGLKGFFTAPMSVVHVTGRPKGLKNWGFFREWGESGLYAKQGHTEFIAESGDCNERF